MTFTYGESACAYFGDDEYDDDDVMTSRAGLQVSPASHHCSPES